MGNRGSNYFARAINLKFFGQLMTVSLTLAGASSAWAVEPGYDTTKLERSGGLDVEATPMGVDFDGEAPADGWITTRVVDIMEPIQSGEPYRVFSYNDGRVFDIAETDTSTLDEVRQAMIAESPVNFLIEGDRILAVAYPEATSDDAALAGIGISTVEGMFRDRDNAADNYTPTRLSSLAQAESLFRNQHSYFKKRSQCYQRAEVWVADMAGQGIKSQKAFMFFTARYIREYRYKWWFHVTPFVMVGDTEYTLDRTFTKRPLTMREWTNEFMYNDRECPVVHHYDDYANNQNSQYCYLRKVPMYYFQPLTIQKRDRKGELVKSFNDWELRISRGMQKW